MKATIEGVEFEMSAEEFSQVVSRLKESGLSISSKGNRFSPLRTKSSLIVPDEEVKRILAMRKQGMNYSAIGEAVRRNRSTVRKVCLKGGV